MASSPRYQWVVSTENNPYMAWQCALFAHSARTRCEVEPLFVVHEDEFHGHLPLLWFRWIEATGGKLLRVPGYRAHVAGQVYAPRNTVGTLIELAAEGADADFVVLFDPDMIFVKRPEFPAQDAADRVGNLSLTKPGFSQLWKSAPLTQRQRAWLRAQKRYSVGVPHVIGTRHLGRLASEWLNLIDGHNSNLPWVWEMSMWDYGIACARLGIDYTITDLAVTNAFPGTPVGNKSIIHYCYGSRTWNKRTFNKAAQPLAVIRGVPRAEPGTVENEIFTQLRELHNAYVDFQVPRSKCPIHGRVPGTHPTVRSAPKST